MGRRAVAGHERHERATVGAMRRRDAEDVGDRGVQVDARGQRVAGACRSRPGHATSSGMCPSGS